MKLSEIGYIESFHLFEEEIEIAEEIDEMNDECSRADERRDELKNERE